MPGNRVFMRFPGVSVYLHLSAFFARDPCRDPYGIGQVVFGRLVCPLFYAAAILLRSALYGQPGLSGPDICPEMPHAGVLAAWAGLFSSPAFLYLSCGHRAFFFLKRNDLQFSATRVRIRHGGDFPGIKQRRSRLMCSSTLALHKGDSATPAQL